VASTLEGCPCRHESFSRPRRAIWLDRGVTRILNKGFTAFEPWRDAILEQEASERHKLGRKIAMEEGWLRYGVTARTDAVLREVLGLSPDEIAALRKSGAFGWR